MLIFWVVESVLSLLENDDKYMGRWGEKMILKVDFNQTIRYYWTSTETLACSKSVCKEAFSHPILSDK